MDKDTLIEFINRQIQIENRPIQNGEFISDDQFYLLLEYKNGYIRAMQDVLYELKEENDK